MFNRLFGKKDTKGSQRLVTNANTQNASSVSSKVSKSQHQRTHSNSSSGGADLGNTLYYGSTDTTDTTSGGYSTIDMSQTQHQTDTTSAQSLESVDFMSSLPVSGQLSFSSSASDETKLSAQLANQGLGAIYPGGFNQMYIRENHKTSSDAFTTQKTPGKMQIDLNPAQHSSSKKDKRIGRMTQTFHG